MIPTPRTDRVERQLHDERESLQFEEMPQSFIQHQMQEALDHARDMERGAIVLHHQTQAAIARQERIAEILGHIYAHQWPDDMKLEDGRTMQFAPNVETTQMFLRGLWKAIKEIPDAIDKAKKDAPI